MEREAVILKKSKVNDWVNKMREDHTVYGPVKYKHDYHFKELEPGMDVTLEYTRTMIPPKKFLHPQKENLITYRRHDGMETKLPEFEKKQVILGAHPCDARAIEVYDVIFGGDLPDVYYWNRRNNTVIVAVTCTVPDENCFCMSLDECGPTLEKKGYDLLLTDIGDSYLVEIGSTEGSLLLQFEGLFEKAKEEHRHAKNKVVEVTKMKIQRKIPDVPGLHDFLESNYEHDAWAKETKKCLSCGTCTLVCPTCFCYHVEDFNRFNLEDGNRIRIWDSCQLIDFAEVAMGENFRKDREARLKWRIFHKLAYWHEQFGTLGCTGCGRCIEYCPADIDMTEILAEIRGDKVYA